MGDAAPDLPTQLRTATAIAAEAADLARSHQLRGVETLEKGPSDLVSVADRAVEVLITTRLGEHFPADHVIGEEGEGAGAPPPAGRRCWYVDPIDGTTNYLRGLPAWGISIGLADADGTLLLGVIVMPVAGEVYTAARGHGAARDGVPIRCSTESRLDRTLVSYAVVGPDRGRWGADRTAGVRALMGRGLGSRMQGCAVADLTAVASGRVDAMLADGLHAWDVAAGLLIAAEAGARISAPDGTTATGAATSFLASGPGVHDLVRDTLLAPPHLR